MIALPGIVEAVDCDEHGVPLDWERCRTCGGNGFTWDGESYSEDAGGRLHDKCVICGGHRSLKAAALWARMEVVRSVREEMRAGAIIRVRYPSPAGDRLLVEYGRCEGCGHPMSDGTWEPNAYGYVQPEHERYLEVARISLANGEEPSSGLAVHFSRCDKGCRHLTDGVPERIGCPECGVVVDGFDPEGAMLCRNGHRFWDSNGIKLASWRPVDVRVGVIAKRAGLDVISGGPLVTRPFDLRPENLGIYCLRCWADRSAS